MTVRHGASPSYAPIRAKAEENRKQMCRGPGFALYSVLDFVVDNYRSVVARFESTIENIEANMFQSEFDQAAIENVYTCAAIRWRCATPRCRWMKYATS